MIVNTRNFEPSKGMLILVVGVYVPVFIMGEAGSFTETIWSFFTFLLSILMNLYVLISAMRLISLKKNVKENQQLAALFFILLLLTLF